MKTIKKLIILISVFCLSLLALGVLGCSKSYTVTFIADGKICTELSGKSGEQFVLPTAPIKDNYTFGGWYFEDTFVNKFTAETYIKSAPTQDKFNVYARYVPYWNGISSKTNFYGDGSVENPYLITSTEELYGLALNTNKGMAYGGKNFKLEADLNLNNYSWSPIGNGGNAFNGIFNGDGHTIYNLKIDKNYDNVGLFGSIYGTIKNLTITNSDIKIEATGVSNAGIVSGYISGTAEKIVIDNATLNINSSYEGNIHLGGVFGYINTSNINLCKSNTKIEGLASRASIYVGGIGGYLYKSTISNSIFNGSIDAKLETDNQLKMYVGGISGTTVNSNLNCCKVDSNINVFSTSEEIYAYVGGISGSAFSTSNLKGAIYSGNINSDSNGICNSGGILGYATDMQIERCLMAGNITTLGENAKFSDHIVGSYGNMEYKEIYVANKSKVQILGVEHNRNIGNSVVYKDAVSKSFMNYMLKFNW